MREGSRGFCAAKRGCKSRHAERKQNESEKEQDSDGTDNLCQADGTEKSGADGVQCIGNRIETGEELQPVRKNRNGKQHSAGDAGDSKQEPFGGVAALKEKQITGGQDSKTGKCEKRNDEDEEDGGPVGGTQWKSEEQRAPGEIDGNAQSSYRERIERGTGEDGWKRSLRDEQMFERAGVPRFFEAAVERIEGGIQVIEKDKTDESKGEVAATLREHLAKFGAVHEASDVIEHRSAKKGLDDFHNERAAIGLRDIDVATEEKPEFTEEWNHG